MKKRIIFFTKYTEAGPSSRYRTYQYLNYCRDAGFEISVKPLFPKLYINLLYAKKSKQAVFLMPFWYLHRFLQLCFLGNADLVFIEYELFPFLPFKFEKFLLIQKKNYIIDYDDAIFHNYDNSRNKFVRKLLSGKLPALIKEARCIITGCSYLTAFAERYNTKVVEIPTSVVFEKYNKISSIEKPKVFTIGWIGVASNSRNVLNILPAIKEFLLSRNAKLKLVGFDASFEHHFEGLNVEIINWEESTEIQIIKSFSVGIMPLDDTPFNRGKCGFKLVQYMACGLPTISTPLPANIDINKSGENLIASTNNEWLKALEYIYSEQGYFRENVGVHNQEIVKNFYSVETNHKKYIELFKNYCS